jgi:GNAT superfamily N-acetyltransferase
VSAPRIVRAEERDGARLLALIDALADYERLPRPEAAARERLLDDAFGARPRFEAFLAEIDGMAVGYAIVFETYSTFLALPTLYLEDLFVLTEHRSQGVGRALFLHCVREAIRHECGRLEWSVLDWNALALGFYERLGARRLSEWLPHRLRREEMERLLAQEPGLAKGSAGG